MNWPAIRDVLICVFLVAVIGGVYVLMMHYAHAADTKLSRVDASEDSFPYGIPTVPQQEKPITVSPYHTVCYTQPLKGWTRMKLSDRNYISERAKHYEVIEAQTLQCVDLSQHPLEYFILREQWWRKRK